MLKSRKTTPGITVLSPVESELKYDQLSAMEIHSPFSPLAPF
ncbi:hypothetical protein [Tenacibaculum xiamenense]